MRLRWRSLDRGWGAVCPSAIEPAHHNVGSDNEISARAEAAKRADKFALIPNVADRPALTRELRPCRHGALFPFGVTANKHANARPEPWTDHSRFCWNAVHAPLSRQ